MSRPVPLGRPSPPANGQLSDPPRSGSSDDDEMHQVGKGHVVIASMRTVTMSALAIVIATALCTGRDAGATLVLTRPAPKAEVVDGVPLIPTTRPQREECEKFANHLKRPVPCPGLLPEPIPDTAASAAEQCIGEVGAFSETACGPAAINWFGNTFELSQSNFQVPSTYVGVAFEQSNGAVVPEHSISGGPLGHFVFMAGTALPYVMTHKRGGNVAPVPSYCSRLNGSHARVQERRAIVYQCSSDQTHNQLELVSGHTLLVWKDAGMTSEVSFHGHSQVNVDLDVAVANATVLVSPRGR